MGKEDKKKIRSTFRTVCLDRDKCSCRGCGRSSETNGQDLDVHHITDRTLMPNGGYVKENGISLCYSCHERAEEFHSTGVASPDFAPEDLYKLIGSSSEAAVKASEKLK